MLFNQRQKIATGRPFARKAGVSLIVVLMFMLVATIAATATYKWITSEGRSSASRMLQREAYQSAVAGIENSRSWMTYHANEVGALVKQFQDGGGKPIKLNNQLTPWLRADQHYDVWVTGIDASSPSNIKMKIQSVGRTRNNAEHSEQAIFNVGGLYRVTIPGNGVTFDFDKAFAGALGNMTNSPTIESALVNGDFSGNQPTVSTSMVVTGNVVLQGPKEGAAGLAGADLYVKKNLTLNGNTIIGATTAGNVASNNVAYVGGDVLSCQGGDLEVRGDLLVEGDYPSDCNIKVSGNFTIGGTLDRGEADRAFQIGKNLVFKPTGLFNWTGTVDYSEKAGVAGKSYLKAVSGKESDDNRKINLGSEIYLYEGFESYFCQNSCKSNAYTTSGCTKADRCMGEFCEGFFESCHKENGIGANVGLKGDRLFSFKSTETAGRVKTRLTIPASNVIKTWSRKDNVLKNIEKVGAASKYWERIDKMDAYGQLIDPVSEKIPQPILLNNTDVWTNRVANRHCAEDLHYGNLDKQHVGDDGAIKGYDMQNADGTKAVLDDINDCYATMVENNDPLLYNGFMVVKFMGDAGANMGKNMSDLTTMSGNFVFYFPEQLTTDFYLPATTENSAILLYIPNGVNSEKFLMGAGPIADYNYNYLLFAEGDAKFKSIKITGSVVMGNSSVAQLDNEAVDLRYNGNVLNAIGNAGLIKQNEAYTNRVNGGAGAAGGGGVAGGEDNYYVATAPQLHVTLVTQYANKEPIPADANAYDELNPSFIVLPRLIHLPKDPYGKLQDYFSVVNLNGSNVQKSMNSVSGCPEIEKVDLLYNHAQTPRPPTIPVGVYECIYTDNGVSVPFYVKVADVSVETAPEVGFAKTYQEMGNTDAKTVDLVFEESETPRAVTVTIQKPTELPENWTVGVAEGVNLATGTTCGTDDDVCSFALSLSDNSPLTLFNVSTTAAMGGDIVFQILNCDGCQVSNVANTERFGISTMARVQRADLSAYCNLSGVSCSDEYQSMTDKATWPDCETNDAWVQAVGTNCVTSSTNNEWNCGLPGAITLQAINANVPEGCTVVIPSDNTNNRIASPTNNGDYTLYASLKAQRQQFVLNFAGEDLTGKTVKVSSARFGSQFCTYTSSTTNCTYNLFTGDKITLEVDDADFAYWECADGSANCNSNELFTGNTYIIESIDGENTITANFNQKDRHCFFDEFNSGKNCSSTGSSLTSSYSYCFDVCSSEGTCDVNNGVFDGNSKWIVLEESNDKIEYSDGRVWLMESHLHGKKQADVVPVKVLSTTLPGLYGTLRAQFLVPRLGRRDDESSVKVRNSGFILRSDAIASNYLMLNVYANQDGELSVQTCVGSNCESRTMNVPGYGNVKVGVTDVVTISATMRNTDEGDVLDVESVIGYYGNYTVASASINVSQISGYSALSGTYMGFSLGDPAFKLYDIGWKSLDFQRECWQSYPTIRCSFNSAYTGGIVPLQKQVRPWVGLSSWFNKRSCTPTYWYNGSDACDNSGVEDDGSASYVQCYNEYQFSSGGPHGITNDNSTYSKMAKVSVQCYGTDEDNSLVYLENGRCGAFWVGDVKNCNRVVTFFSGSRELLTHTVSDKSLTIYTENELFLKNANVRGAVIQISLINPTDGTDDASELEIYLRSTQNNQNSYSKTAVSTKTGQISIDVDELSNVEGFDPEHVTAVIIRNHGTKSVTINEVKSQCEYAPELTCPTDGVTYDAGKFNLSVIAKGSEHASSYAISATESESAVDALTTSLDCSVPETCPNGGLEGQITLSTPAYNPFGTSFTESKTYVFTVAMKTMDDEASQEQHVTNSPCTMSYVLTPISVECRINGAATKGQGKGLPDFQYKVSGCPSTGCDYEVKFGSDPLLSTLSGNTSGWTSIPTDKRTSFNTQGAPLTPGTNYSITIQSQTGATAKINSCSQTFEVAEAGAQSEDYQANCWWEKDGSAQATALAGSASMNFKVTTTRGFSENTKGKLIFNGTETEIDLYSNGNTSGISNYSSMPSPGVNHPYSVVYNGETVCTGVITTVAPLTCEIPNEVEFNTSYNFVVTKNSLVNNCWDCNCSGTSECNYNGSNAFTVTSSNNPLTLSISCKCNDGFLAECSRTALAEVVAPAISCSSTAIDVEPGTNITAPVTIENCEGGCTYSVVSEGDVIVTGAADPSTYNTTSVTFPGENDLPERNTPYEYTLTVNNDEGSPTCKIKVNYKKPSYSCPDAITAEPGTQVTVTPTNVSYCSGGCDYKITGTGIDDIEGENFTSGSLADKIVDTSDPITGKAVTGGVAKKYSLTLSNAAGSGTACDVTVNYMKPTFSCPTNIPDQSVNAEVQVTPTGINYCTNGCTYKITGGKFTDNTSAGNLTVTSGGSAAIKKIKGESTASTGDGTEYTLTLHNPAGDNATACKFKVKYTEEPAGCTCIAWVNGTGDYDKNCYSSGLNNMGGKCYTMNPDRGTSPTNINNNADDTYWWSVVSCTEWTGCSGSGSGGGGDDGINWTNNTTLEAGTHTIAKCNGYTGTKTTQITASFADCWGAFSATTGAGYWNNVTGNCNGWASVTYPVTVTVPSGGTLTLSNCY